ncbi:MAG: hypothetical protein GY854_26405 [Deltaproteobacteria bacterium]|nr:hypothetical protein [Deltaproteobacteria bacterium]
MDLENLNILIRKISTLNETDAVVVSCYLNLEAGRASYRSALDARVREIRRALPSNQRHDFEEALGRIEVFLASDVNPEANGMALFSRGGKSPFFLPLQFGLLLPNHMMVDSIPHIYELMKLKDTYHRYVVLISTETYARIIEVSVGGITKELWTERPELRKRVGREWTTEHYQNHRRDRAQKFIKEKIKILEHVVAKGEHTHLVLTGEPRTVSRVRAGLPKHLREKLVDVVSVPGKASTEDVVSVTLSAFAEHEQKESIEMAGLLLDELRTGGLAVSGIESTLEALARGQGDVLVLSESFEESSGWKCSTCERVGVDTSPMACPQCGERTVGEVAVKEEMMRLAARFGTTVEIVRSSDVMFEIGGVGCLLLYLLPVQRMVDPE